MSELYHEFLLDLYKHPLNKKTLSDFDIRLKEFNPLCGDTVELSIQFDKNGAAQDIGWQGDGCAISQTASSLLTDFSKGKSKTELQKITAEQILEMLGLHDLNPTRLRCATLCLETLKKCLS